MRISTAQIYQSALSAMQKQQASLQQTELQIASGLRIQKPSDDPAGAVKVLNLSSNLGQIEQYSRNIALAETNLAHEESVLSAVTNSLQRIRELTVQANNPTYPDSARLNIALEVEARLDELLTLANTRDANGEYIFAGNRVNTPPFMRDGDEVNYAGDQSQRMIQIGDGAQVVVRDSGDKVFQKIRAGDGKVEVMAAPSNSGTLLVGQFGLTGDRPDQSYTVTFSAATAGSPASYEVTDSGIPVPAVVASGNYEPGTNISAAGVQFSVTGMPAEGDSITIQPARNVDLFSMVKDIADAMRTPVGNDTERARVQNSLAQGLANLDQSMDNIGNHRSAVGARLNNIESIDTINQNFKLQLETVLSDTRDLDFAEAISRFQLQLTSLEAAQQAFARTAELSLFRYL